MIGYFITGTDTNVGKTYVTCALARRAGALGHRVFAFKPIETGCLPGRDGALVGSDQELLCEAAGGWQRGALRGAYRFKQPAAPLVAADSESAAIDLDVVASVAQQGSSGVAVSLIEGAGGWRVPITPKADMAAMAKLLGFPVLIVARAGLGTINHTLLTIEAIERDGLHVAGVVLSERPDDDHAMTLSNREQIGRIWQGPIVVLGPADALDPFLSGSPVPRLHRST